MPYRRRTHVKKYSIQGHSLPEYGESHSDGEWFDIRAYSLILHCFDENLLDKSLPAEVKKAPGKRERRNILWTEE